MMVSDWIGLWRGFLSTAIGFQAVVVFILVSVAVLAYRVTSGIESSLALAGVFTLSFLLMSLTIEHRGEPQAIGLLLAVFAGVGRVSYARLLK